MTLSEVLVVVGGLVLGYWLVNVFVPHLLGKKSLDEKGYGSEEFGDAQERFEGQSRRTHSGRSHAQAGSDAATDRKWFEILEVSENATHDQIVAAYKSQISQYHPDKVARMGTDIRRLAEARSKAINAAYDEALRR